MDHASQKPLAVVLVSGGMDSCVTAAILAQTHRLALLHINYGQRTEQRELQAFHDIAHFYNARDRLIVDLGYLKQIGGSSLTQDDIPVPEANLDHRTVPNTYVPFRNANLLAIATSWAEVIRARTVAIGAVYEDATGYPDCSPPFFEAFNRLIETGTIPGSGIHIATPILRMKKSEIILTGRQLDAPFHLTWSCYQAEDRACGRCDSCALRLRGFREAGLQDPIPYAEIRGA